MATNLLLAVLLQAGQAGAIWTVVHSKARASASLQALQASAAVSRQAEDPEHGSGSVNDQIWDMGMDMCKGREDHPACQHFKPKEKEEPTEAPTEPPAEPAAAPMAAPAAAPATSPAAAPGAAPAGAPGSSPAAAPAGSPGPAPADDDEDEAPVVQKDVKGGLPEHGFHGPKVKYVDGETQTSDWHDEYDHPSPPPESTTVKKSGGKSSPKKSEKSAATSSKSHSNLMIMGATLLLVTISGNLFAAP